MITQTCLPVLKASRRNKSPIKIEAKEMRTRCPEAETKECPNRRRHRLLREDRSVSYPQRGDLAWQSELTLRLVLSKVKTTIELCLVSTGSKKTTIAVLRCVETWVTHCWSVASASNAVPLGYHFSSSPKATRMLFSGMARHQTLAIEELSQHFRAPAKRVAPLEVASQCGEASTADSGRNAATSASAATERGWAALHQPPTISHFPLEEILEANSGVLLRRIRELELQLNSERSRTSSEALERARLQGQCNYYVEALARERDELRATKEKLRAAELDSKSALLQKRAAELEKESGSLKEMNVVLKSEVDTVRKICVSYELERVALIHKTKTLEEALSNKMKTVTTGDGDRIERMCKCGAQETGTPNSSPPPIRLSAELNLHDYRKSAAENAETSRQVLIPHGIPIGGKPPTERNGISSEAKSPSGARTLYTASAAADAAKSDLSLKVAYDELRKEFVKLKKLSRCQDRQLYRLIARLQDKSDIIAALKQEMGGAGLQDASADAVDDGEPPLGQRCQETALK